MADESLLGAALRSDNSETLAYSGYNHDPPIGSTLSDATYAGAIPQANDYGENNFRIPWQGVNNTDGGNTFIQNSAFNADPTAIDGTTRPMLRFTIGNANENERFTNNYQGNQNRLAKADRDQTWHLRAIVKYDDAIGAFGERHDISLWAFGLAANGGYDFATYDIYTNTKTDADAISHPTMDHIVVEGYSPQQVNFGSQENPIDVNSKSSFQFRVEDVIWANAPRWVDINAYFIFRNSFVQSVTCRFDFDNGDNNDRVLIDKWSLRPMNIKMSDFNIVQSSDISLNDHIYQDINITAPS